MRLLIVALSLVFLISTAKADNDDNPRGEVVREYQSVKKRYNKKPRRINQATIVAHPAGCPRRLFCGCGVSLHVFGKAVRAGGLALAKNWLAFPRSIPGPGKVAARMGHVFAILEDRGGGKVLAYNPNSGAGKTRIHVMSLRGYTVVDPRGARRYASL